MAADNSAPAAPAELWRHPAPEDTAMFRFLQYVNSKRGLGLAGYPALYRWSINDVAAFWEDTWHFVGIRASRPFHEVLPANSPMFPRPDFFAGSRLNFAENLLFPADVAVDELETAVITVDEADASGASTSWAALRDAVCRCSIGLRAAGVGQHDVVAGFVANHVQAVVAMLAAASIGAIWTGISPDSGVSAVLDRLAQIAPVVLFADNAAVYNGKEWPMDQKIHDVVEDLRARGLRLVVVVQSVKGVTLDLKADGVSFAEYEQFLSSAPDSPLRFEQLPPSHPVYILYSSGTTGKPKAIVHTALGTLIQHKKEHCLHCSLTSSSRMLYFTTVSWMMWHWSVSALAVGASLVLYSGSPFRPHGHLSMAKLLSSFKVTHFGTSAAYLSALEANGVFPASDPSIDLSALEAVYSTASPLPPSTFSYVYKAFPPRVNLASITGGTDIISLFGAPCPLVPVRVGEIQCAGLGMAISVVDSAADADAPQPVPPGTAGDLVCVKPFPCQPLTFFGPGGDALYRAAYFERFPGLWHHGDFVRMDPATGGLVMLGRSDGVLKPAGVRFGSAEIYNVLARFFAADVDDAVCVGRRRETDRDETVCLFVVMAAGKAFDPALRDRIRKVIKEELSPRHVPGVLEECGAGVPKTGNGKKIEVAVKKILSGMDAKTNASVANPEALDWFRAWAAKN